MQSPSPYTRLGAKGIAEGNQYSTPVCLANAVADALGRSDISVPLKPAKILEWMSDPNSRSASRRCARMREDPACVAADRYLCRAMPSTVWAALLNDDKLRQAIPGCEQLTRTGANAFTATVVLGVGPVKGQFGADVALSDLEEPRSARLSGNLSGPLGAASGEGWLASLPQDGGCRIDYRLRHPPVGPGGDDRWTNARWRGPPPHQRILSAFFQIPRLGGRRRAGTGWQTHDYGEYFGARR